MPCAATRRTPRRMRCTAERAFCCYSPLAPHASHARRGAYTATRCPTACRTSRRLHSPPPYVARPAPPHAARPATHPPLATLHVVRVRPAAAALAAERHMWHLPSVFGCGTRRARRGVRCVARRTPYIFAPRRRARRTCATHTRRTRCTAVRALRTRRTHDSMHGGATAGCALRCFPPHAPPLAARPVTHGVAYSCAPPPRMSQHACTAHGARGARQCVRALWTRRTTRHARHGVLVRAAHVVARMHGARRCVRALRCYTDGGACAALIFAHAPPHAARHAAPPAARRMHAPRCRACRSTHARRTAVRCFTCCSPRHPSLALPHVVRVPYLDRTYALLADRRRPAAHTHPPPPPHINPHTLFGL
ncbi:hypothetical protein GGX14DRAFT_618357 [Mycena pura]|uniref:Uncharacterized protein n=1 Tax=Mycena pura TaxID=153505 RepID=A0AAD6VKH1_9AGAR|nr:hypothetical protein GGX14DRAFT_618357 [Mycena pura]